MASREYFWSNFFNPHGSYMVGYLQVTFYEGNYHGSKRLSDFTNVAQLTSGKAGVKSGNYDSTWLCELL